MSVQCFCGSWDHEPFRHPSDPAAPLTIERQEYLIHCYDTCGPDGTTRECGECEACEALSALRAALRDALATEDTKDALDADIRLRMGRAVEWFRETIRRHGDEPLDMEAVMMAAGEMRSAIVAALAGKS